MKLLLVESDLQLGQATCKELMRLGYAVDWLTSGERLGITLDDYKYDCVLLDHSSPDGAGGRNLQSIRRAKCTAPVIMLTARAERDAAFVLLDQGADDYLPKPYRVNELAARVRAVVRRSGKTTVEDDLDSVHGPLRLDRNLQAVYVAEQRIDTTNKEFCLLDALMRNRQRIMTRRMLEEALYGWDDERSSNAIDVFIYQLRRKLGSHFILTVRGVGYRLASLEEMGSAKAMNA